MEEDRTEMMGRSEAVTYVFAVRDNTVKMHTAAKAKMWQLVPCVGASLSCIPFGLMLGWPSPTYPTLLNETTSPIPPITIDQSAMIAGFLMIGNTLGTPLSSRSYCRSKYGILLAVIFMASGWFVMWQARNIYYLLGSRLLVGFGNGFGTGQLKIYIGGMCDEYLKTMLWKQINLYVFFGVVAVYSYGAFLDFRQISIASLVVSVVLIVLVIFLPSTPKELVKADQVDAARRIIACTKPQLDANEEITRIQESIDATTVEYGLTSILKNGHLRRKFLIFTGLVFCQQGSGAPATIIYTQLLLERSLCPFPSYFAIGYVLVFFLANVVGIFVSPKCNKRYVLLLSCLGVSVLCLVKICVIFFEVNRQFNYVSVPVMYSFIFLHTIGLGNIPFTLINDVFTKEYRTCITHFFVMLHSMLALIITKIFQFLIDRFYLDTPFYLFLSFSLIGVIIVYYFLPQKTDPKIYVVN